MGAARLLRGLARILPPAKLSVVVNTGDDDVFYGLHVSPDLDTIVYTLAGMVPFNPGWGIRGDSFRVRDELECFYGPGWFALGDRDLATHIFRTDRLRSGESLSECTRQICRSRGVECEVLPMSDDRVRTVVHTPTGPLSFQDYLVKNRAKPRVVRIEYRGATRAKPAPGVLSAVTDAELLVIAPSNPLVSIGPMLALPGFRAALRDASARTIAVSPLIRGRAVKGPLASMLRSLGYAVDNGGIASLYRGLASELVVAPDDVCPGTNSGWPRMVQHNILLSDTRRAAALARFILSRGSRPPEAN